MQADQSLVQLQIELQINPVDDCYFQLTPKISLSPELAPKLVRQSYVMFIIELRTGIKHEDLPKIRNYFLGLCEDIIENTLRGISFVINGEHHIIQNYKIEEIRELFSKTFAISLEDDYAKTLIKARHAIQKVSQRLGHSIVSLIFFFSHLQIDHQLGVKKISYINYLNQHADECLDEVKHLSKNIKRFTDQCKTFIISYDKNGVEETDYSLCDTDLMNQINMYVGNWGSTINRNYSYNQLAQSFQNVSGLLTEKMYSLTILLPIYPRQDTHGALNFSIHLQCKDLKSFKHEPFYIKRQHLDTNRLKTYGLSIQQSKNKQGLEEKLGLICAKTNVSYIELQGYQLLISQAKVCSLQINQLCRVLSNKIVSYKRRYEGGKAYIDMKFDKDLFLDTRDQLEFYYERSKAIFALIQGIKTKGQAQLKAYEAYTQLKTKIDAARAVLTDILKKQIGGSQIGKLSQVINLGAIKNSLRNKLLKRISANPFLLDQVYQSIYKIADGGTIDYLQNEVDSGDLRYNLGNCVLTDYNFVKAMKEYDALGIAFEIERPMSAIADPGRIRIRQVSPSLMRVSTFFQKFLYKIELTPQVVELVLQSCRYCQGPYCSYNRKCKYTCGRVIDAEVHQYTQQIKQIRSLSWNQNPSKNDFNPDKLTLQEKCQKETKEIDFLRQKGALQRQNYQERCDYTNKVEQTQTVLGFMPLFLTDDHWKIAKLLMKPCLAFTATSQPLGYLFAQYQTIPFIVVSSMIRTCKQMEYHLKQKIEKLSKIPVFASNKDQISELKAQIKIIQKRFTRMKHISNAIQATCRAILLELSTEKFQTPLLATIHKKYQDYKKPINRTIDVITNNSSFLSQLYLAFKYNLLQKPRSQSFDHFFVRLIEQELRRQTDGWNQEQTQDAFLYKLLNLDPEKIRKQQKSVVTMMDEYSFAQKFQKARQGQSVSNAFIQIQRQQLQLMMTKGGKFNDNQRLLMIQYKRLYENRVLWMWYVRFLLYGQMERIAIHKWKCLGLINSYMLFTMIIQNKKQRKNYKRREAISNGEYADPFDYHEAKEHLQRQFSELYSKILQSMAQEVKVKHASNSAQVFAMSEDLQEAAGVLLAPHGLMPKIFENLIYQDGPLFADKLEMLVHGVYQGVRLFAGWKPSRKRTNRLRGIIQYERYKYRF